MLACKIKGLKTKLAAPKQEELVSFVFSACDLSD